MSELPNWKVLGQQKQAAADAEYKRTQEATEEQQKRLTAENAENIELMKRARTALLTLSNECTRIAGEFNQAVHASEIRLRVNSQHWDSPGNLLSFEVWRGNGTVLSSYRIYRPGEITVKTYSNSRPFVSETEIYVVHEKDELMVKGQSEPISYKRAADINCERLINFQGS